MTTPSTWWFVSDLHLDPVVADTRGVAQRFPEFVAQVVLATGGPGRHLVLLGDSFEVDGCEGRPPSQSVAVCQLDVVADRFGSVFAALRLCVEDGVTVHLVCGNHDVALARPAVRARLKDLVTGSASTTKGSERLRLHPWLVHVPGLFYAEHGNQHHELNRFPLLLSATQTGCLGDLGLTPLAAWAKGPEQSRPLPRVRGVASAVRAAHRAERRAGQADYQALVHAAAAEGDLPGDVALALQGLSRFSALPAGMRTLRRVVWRQLGAQNRDSYLREAAGRIDSILTKAGSRPLCYVFGHTHEAVLASMSRPGSFYANSGTWSPHVADPGATDLERFPYVVIHSDGEHRSVLLCYWPSEGSVEKLRELAEADT